MEFCKKCGSLMLPKKEKNKTILICSKCGHKIAKFEKDKYKITKDVDMKPKDVAVIETEKKKKSEEERRYIQDLYGKEVYEISEE